MAGYKVGWQWGSKANWQSVIQPDVLESILSQLNQLNLKQPHLFDPPGQKKSQWRGTDFYSYQDFVQVIVRAAQAFKIRHNVIPSIVEPKTFSEHVFHRKFFSRHPLPSLSNKLASRQYVRNLLGERFVTEVVWVGKALETMWTSPILPGKYFLKANHGSGFNFQLTAPDDLIDKRNEIVALANQWLNTPYGVPQGEWPYATYSPELFLEKFLEFRSGALPDDYKFYCFNGRPKFIKYISGRSVSIRKSHFDPSWNAFPIAVDEDLRHENPVEKPRNLEEMIAVASKIASQFDFVRVDLYSDGIGAIVFSELTFTPGDALNKFSDPAFDLYFGNFFNECTRSG